MDVISDTCKYHPDYSVTIFQVKVIGGHEVKKVEALNFGILVVQYMFLVIFYS